MPAAGVGAPLHRDALRWQPLRHTAVRLLVLVSLAVLAGAIHVRRPVTLCPLRALTGLPCPLCGGSTAAVQVGSGNLGAAVRTAPVLLALAAAGVTAPLGPGRWWRELPARWQWALLAGGAIAAEAWQLVRFGVVPT